MSASFPYGDSAMAQAVRAYDWAATPLGPTTQWPSPLRNAVSLMLSSPESMYVVWGDALTFFYNDAYTPILGPRQPHALGAPLQELWADAWEAVRAPIEAAFAGRASRFEEVPIGMNRYGTPEDTWWTFSFSPIYLDDGRVGGAFCVTNEVTDRKVAQNRLADEHERLIRLFEQAPMFMAFLSGPQHRVEFANPCYSRLIGHRDVIGKPLAEALPDLVEQGHLHRLDEVYQSGRAYAANALAYNVQAEPGGRVERRLLDLVYQPIAGADGTVSGIFVQGLDITDRIGLERAVREAEVRNRQILDSVMDYAIIATDLHGLVTSWNEGAQRILGWSEAEMLGQTLERTFTPEDVERRQILIEAAAALESGSGMDERWHVRKSGQRFWANGSLMVLRDETGAAIGFVKVLRDRTAERLASEALRESERRLDALVRASSQSIFSASADWRELRQLVGEGALSDARSASLNWQQEMVHPDDRARLAEAIAHSIVNKTGLDVEYRVLDADQRVGWTLMRAIPLLDEREQIVEWFGTAADITDKRLAEQQLRQLTETLEERVRERSAALLLAEEKLRQSQKMEAVGQLTGGLAHDFNNLLTAISVGLELLQTRIEQGKYDRLERYVEMAQSSAARATALTQRLLAFSRRQTLAPTSLEVQALVQGMHDIIARTLGPSIALQLRPAAAPWKVLVDAPQLENALLNLCINARDAMPDGGELTIAVANRVLDAGAAQQLDLPIGEYVCLSVQDTGTGMSADVMSKVFEPFFTTKPIGQGTGLGLSMIYGFTRQSGGHVRIDSEVGVGTTMALYLPRFDGVLAQDEAVPATEQPLRSTAPSCTVLLVEDETAIRVLMSEVLSEAGYRVIETAEGNAAVERLRSQETIDLLVTDVGLTGGLNGRQVADAGRQYRPTLPVLFVTGYAATAAVGAGQLEEGMEVLTKPFLTVDLERRVAQLLERKSH
ncbi:PAS domain-containing protein [Xanthomonas arboricola pv. corylina]|uniref:hybrid sensor histidine kinase/response regulator n=1 Tax=Xanthomonas arboricola TaxID=56448 RepID=UPI000CEDFAEA|nr:PAS domain-containing protein [Xanthomonas arboricola]MDN0203802.1 PAS domain-containing protein [Xanthomonas arboricola pv. corylina]MDN0216843.1 PAS domain-containing protein [Xanthomonas arboricola pv. corylina]PPU59790.1 hybrid sensor histidine kinase/response regulator [Xanthomonas arboricola pv. corylina]CAE6798753.1 Sensor histidine kinase RcsC [Xanthomonas arboricola pv. corylina]CAE6798776.1 Sensor histidine kinase RcsC [Xanthomonas arboricola pv. corylina]